MMIVPQYSEQERIWKPSENQTHTITINGATNCAINGVKDRVFDCHKTERLADLGKPSRLTFQMDLSNN